MEAKGEERMKSKVSKDRIWIVALLVALALGFAIFVIAALFMETKKIREFKVDVFVLSNESDICMAEGPDGTVKMSADNLPAIYSIILKSKGRIVFGEPVAQDTVVFEFDCHDEDWTMTVDEIDEDKIRVNLEGPRNYTMYLNNNKNFEAFQKAASADGYVSKNKVIK